MRNLYTWVDELSENPSGRIDQSRDTLSRLHRTAGYFPDANGQDPLDTLFETLFPDGMPGTFLAANTSFDPSRVLLDHTGQVAGKGQESATDQVTDQVTDPVARLLRAFEGRERSAAELIEALGLQHLPSFRALYLKPVLVAGLVEMTLPDKPQSSKQRYRLTRVGMGWIARHS